MEGSGYSKFGSFCWKESLEMETTNTTSIIYTETEKNKGECLLSNTLHKTLIHYVTLSPFDKR